MNTRLVLAGVLGMVLASSAAAQVSIQEAQARMEAKHRAASQPAGDDVAHLRQIVENLQAQVAQLRAENAALRKRLAKSAPEQTAAVAPAGNGREVVAGMTKAQAEAVRKKFGRKMDVDTEEALVEGKRVVREVWTTDPKFVTSAWPYRITLEDGVVVSIEKWNHQ